MTEPTLDTSNSDFDAEWDRQEKGGDPNEAVAAVVKDPVAAAAAAVKDPVDVVNVDEKVDKDPPPEDADVEDADPDEALWKDVPEATRSTLKARLETERVAREHAEHQARTDAGRVAAFQRKVTGLETQLSKAAVAQPDALAAVLDPAQWTKFETEFPDIAAPIKAALGGVIKLNQKATTDAVTPVAQQVSNNYKAAQIAAVTEAHSDYESVMTGAEYSKWLLTQPVAVQGLMESDEANDYIWLLDTFKAATTPKETGKVAAIKDKRKQRVEQAAALPGTRGAADNSRIEIPDEWDAAWDAYDRKDAASAKK